MLPVQTARAITSALLAAPSDECVAHRPHLSPGRPNSPGTAATGARLAGSPHDDGRQDGARAPMTDTAGRRAREVLSVAGRDVAVTNLDRVLYPASGTTKRDVLTYLVQASPSLLGVLAGRPVSRRRWPDGVGRPGFMEKNVPAGAPAWIPRVTLQHEDGDVTYPLVTDVACLVWLGQVAALELHVPQWRLPASHPSASSPRTVDRFVLDLDPGEPAGLAEAAVVALAARRLLADDGLDSVPVTSGSKGIHVYAAAPAPFPLAESTSAYARTWPAGSSPSCRTS